VQWHAEGAGQTAVVIVRATRLVIDMRKWWVARVLTINTNWISDGCKSGYFVDVVAMRIVLSHWVYIIDLVF
jgi:hypothetical protein